MSPYPKRNILATLKNKTLQPNAIIAFAGIVLVMAFLFMTMISDRFDYGLEDINKPIIPLVVLMMAAGAVYLFVIIILKDRVFSKGLMLWVILVGLFLRLSMFTSHPMLEDDHYRYLWDGGVLVNGFNPYRYSPSTILHERGKEVPEAIRQLAEEAAPVINRINHPGLRTIYPPLSQCAFALAHLIKPWSLGAWRLVLLAMDLVTFSLVFILLGRLSLPPIGLVVYWWNPLLIKEVYNSGHMDIILFPFLLVSFLFAMRSRYISASGALGLAVGVKFWPAILLPVVLRPVMRDPKNAVPATLLFSCLSISMFLPFYFTGLDAESGITAYGRYWEMNDALFMLMLWAVKLLMKIFSMDVWNAQVMTRTLVVCILIFWTIRVIKVNDHSPAEINHRFLLVIAALFLLSPTQFPWYYLWMLPFLAMCPIFSLLTLSALLPLYYFRSYLDARGMTKIYDNGVVWLEYMPVWYLLVWEWFREREPLISKEEKISRNAERC